MKYILLLILTFLTYSSSIGQDINKIIFTSQGFDEPPTKQGMPLLTVEYTKDDSGYFSATHYLKNKKKRKLDTPVKIETERIAMFRAWREKGLKVFELSDFALTDELVRDRSKSKNFKTTFDLPNNPLIDTDSFSYCQKWKLTKRITTGGHNLEIAIHFSNGEADKYAFGSNDLGMGQFDLKGFLYSYQLLSSKIPNQVHQYDFFTHENLSDIILTYFKTVECEGYYYNEFTDNNPTRTAAENRTMKDWNFFEYMKGRNLKKNSGDIQPQKTRLY